MSRTWRAALILGTSPTPLPNSVLLGDTRMLDILFVFVSIAFFALAIGYVVACERWI